MAKVINNRVYLDPEKDFHSEQSEGTELARELKLKNYTIIILEDELKSDCKYLMHIEGNEFERLHLVLNYWMNIFDIKEPSAEYISLGTWENTSLDEEIRESFSIIEEKKFTNQTKFLIKKDEKLVKYIRDKYKNNKKSIDWFNLYLLSGLKGDRCEFMSHELGAEMRCYNLTCEKVETLLNCLDNNNLFIRVEKDR